MTADKGQKLRSERLAEELRVNLMRRKELARTRAAKARACGRTEPPVVQAVPLPPPPDAPEKARSLD